MTVEVVPSDPAAFKKRCLADTGFLARNLLGFNYDEAEGGRKTNIGTGGIVNYGKHLEICELLDDRDIKCKLVIAPRESRKSTLLQAFIVRQILLNPDIRVFYVARTDAMARDKALAIRRQLENPNLVRLFGEQAGKPWEETRFTIRGRRNTALMNATVQGFSMDSLPVGGRCNLLAVDDFIDDTNVTNATQNKKSKAKYAHLQPFVAKGGILVVVGTIWDDDDLYADLQASSVFAPPSGGQVVCGVGVDVFYGKNGKMDLMEDETGITFPHLTVDYLRGKLQGMLLEGKSDLFVKQYLNIASTEGGNHFERRFFQPVKWGDDMRQLSGFIVTDTAISQEDSGCYSVVAYVALDASDNIYLLDLRLGHWTMTEFVDEFFTMLEHWQAMVNHIGECWEEAHLSTAFREAIEYDKRARKVRLRTIEMPRTSKNKKTARINRLQHPMANRRFWVCNTVPATFMDVDGEKELWNPTGHYDARTKALSPSGELVDEFVRSSSKKDIPDALAMILEYEKTRRGVRRKCTFKPWTPPPLRRSLTAERNEAYHVAQYSPNVTSGDWWDNLLHDPRFDHPT